MKKRILIALAIFVITCASLVACNPDNNDGFKVNFIVDGEVLTTVETSGEETITLPADPTKTGYVFDGWFRDKDVWQVPFTADSLLNEKLTSDLDVYAKFTQNGAEVSEFTVTYNANGGKFGTEDTITARFKENSTLAAPSVAPTRAGYELKGWAKTASGDAIDLSKEKVTGDITLYAVWEQDGKKYTVTLDVEDGVDIDMKSIEVTEGKNFELPIPSKAGSKFAGWYDGETQITGPDGRSLAPYNFGQDKTFTAKWGTDLPMLNVVLEGNGAPENVASVSGIGEHSAGESVTLTIELNLGYIFDGWYLGDTDLLEEKATYTFDMPSVDTTYVAKYHIDEKLTSFNFTSTTDTLSITGVTGNKSTIDTIDIPDYVTSISANILNGCSGLKSLSVPFIGGSTGDPQVFGWFFGTEQYDNAKGVQLEYDGPTYQIPLGLKEVTVYGGDIPERAFENCTMIRRVTLGDGVTKIGGGAFENCSGLMSVTIGKNVTSIEVRSENPSGYYEYKYYAFDGCTKLYEVYNLSSKITVTAGEDSEENGKLGVNALIVHTSADTPSVIDDTSSAPYVFYIGDTANNASPILLGYDGTPSDITLPNDYDGEDYEIGSYAFAGYSTLGSVKFGEKVTKVRDHAFYFSSSGDSSAVSSLTTVTFNEGLTEIGANAFTGNGKLTSITIPDSLIRIGSSAFSTGNASSMFGNTNNMQEIEFGNNPKLEYIGNGAFSGTKIVDLEIPDSVTEIGYNAFNSDVFASSHPLKTVTLGKGIEKIGRDAFAYQYSLETVNYTGDFADWFKITFESTGSNPASLSGNLYIDDKNMLEGDVEIPDGVEAIPGGMFAGSTITEVTFNDELTEIGDSAFQNCTGLTEIDFPESVTNIGQSAFAGCAITTLEIPENITNIGNYAFQDCKSLTSVYIHCDPEVGWGAFSGCTSILEVWNLGEAEITIGDSSSFGGVAQYAVVIHEDKDEQSGLDTVDSYKFIETDDKVYLLGYTGTDNEITLPDKYKKNGNGEEKEYYVRSNALSNLPGVTKITIPEGVKIESSAFAGNTTVTEVKLPKDMTEISSSLFSGCSALTTVNLSDLTSVTRIGDSAFKGCSALEEVDFDKLTGLTAIGDNAFEESGLTKAELSNLNVLANIDACAFMECSSLKEVTLPEGLETLGGSAFSYSAITSITIPDSITEIEGYMFNNCSKLTTVTLGKNVTSIGSSAFQGCSSLTTIELPASLTYIGGGAFTGTGLTKAEFKDPSNWATVNYGEIDKEFDANELNDPATAAKYLINYEWDEDPGYTYSDWYKIQEVEKDGFKFRLMAGEWILYEYTGSDDDIVLPENVTHDEKTYSYTLGTAFAGTEIKSIKISKGVHKISVGAFDGCESLTSVTFEVTEGWEIESYYGDNTPIPEDNFKEDKMDELISLLTTGDDDELSNVYYDWVLSE